MYVTTIVKYIDVWSTLEVNGRTPQIMHSPKEPFS